MSNEFDEVKLYNEKDEPVDIRQYPAFKSDESYNAFVKDVIELEDRIKRGEERMYTSEEVDRYFEEKFKNAELQSDLYRKRA